MDPRNIQVVSPEAVLNKVAVLLLVEYRTFTVGYICSEKWANLYLSTGTSLLPFLRAEVRDL